jgi:hypothetical protein
MTPYHFTLLRYIHDASSEEFANVGVLMWLPEERRLLFRMHERYARLSAFFGNFDGVGYRQMSKALVRRVRGLQRELEQGTLLVEAAAGIGAIMTRLVPEDSTCFGWSKAMGGIADDAELRLEQLLSEFVTSRDATAPRERRDEAQIFDRIDETLSRRGLAGRLSYGFEIYGQDYSYRFRTAWVNGQRQVLEPISFDYLNATEVVEKANTWSGRLLNLSRGAQFQMTGVVAKPTRRELVEAYDQAVAILRQAPSVRAVVPEEELEQFVGEIEQDLAQHPE